VDQMLNKRVVCYYFPEDEWPNPDEMKVFVDNNLNIDSSWEGKIDGKYLIYNTEDVSIIYVTNCPLIYDIADVKRKLYAKIHIDDHVWYDFMPDDEDFRKEWKKDVY
jgi:hypothetical protein